MSYDLLRRSRAALTGLGATWLLGLLLATSAGALTYVMPTDDELLERAEVVVLARVIAAENSPTDRRPATDYLVEIDEPLKGFVPASTILVRVPGGLRSDGLRVRAFGIPEFTAGERVLLFLSPRASGTYELVETGLGAFRRVEAGGRSLLIRDLSAASELRLGGDPRAAERRRSHLPRDLERFAAWLSDRDAGEAREADYFVDAPAGPIRELDAFTLTRSPGLCGINAGLPVRWTEFDRGASVRVLVNENLQPGVADGGIAGIQRSIAAWNNDAQSVVRLVYGGLTSAAASALASDNRNLVLFEDPFDDISGSFNGSGTLAVTWVAFDCDITHGFGGEVAHTLFEADIVTQNGSGSFYFGKLTELDFDEVIGHELGHFIGVGHACGDNESPLCSTSNLLDDALMRAFVHGDNRGARLNNDDRNAVRFLYPKAASNDQSPTAPTTLSAVALSTSEIQLDWLDTASNETGFDVEERTIDGDFVLVAATPADTTSLIVGSIPQGTFRSYRVRARNAGGSSAYSNEASATTLVPIGACVEDGSTLCLNGDRFRVNVVFEDFEGGGGAAVAEELTDDTGYFTFFDAANVEVVVKALDACDFSQRYWVFAGGLTNVEVTIVVSDTTTGTTNTYFNPLGSSFLPVQDTNAFATCVP
ncbi:MAG TPA: hypothetical protein VMV46_21665 [Thermoanaerobaculia bacterium]|nr:hypothetical protein [Thermoanaerobaculia bacterium]